MIMVANADGTGLIQATPEPLAGLLSWTLSPDGQDLLVTTNVMAVAKLGHPRRRRVTRALHRLTFRCRATRTSSSPRSTVLPMAAKSSCWPSLPAPPRAASTSSTRRLARRSGRSSSRRRMPTCSAHRGRRPATPSATAGSPLAGDGPRGLLHVVAADGTGDRQTTTPVQAIAFNVAVSLWSNDGTRLVMTARQRDSPASPDRARDGRRASRRDHL